MKSSELESILLSTHSGESVRKLGEVYADLEKAQEEFAGNNSISCPEGCGECCVHYRPYLTETEALVAAFHVLEAEREDEILSLLEKDQGGETCPLYVADNPCHCSLYKGRSLVCRLFGFAATTDKTGDLVYRSCRWSPVKMEKKNEDLKGDVPVMAAYGERMEDCSDSGMEGEDISIALRRAISKLQFLSSLVSAGDRE